MVEDQVSKKDTDTVNICSKTTKNTMGGKEPSVTDRKGKHDNQFSESVEVVTVVTEISTCNINDSTDISELKDSNHQNGNAVFVETERISFSTIQKEATSTTSNEVFQAENTTSGEVKEEATPVIVQSEVVTEDANTQEVASSGSSCDTPNKSDVTEPKPGLSPLNSSQETNKAETNEPLLVRSPLSVSRKKKVLNEKKIWEPQPNLYGQLSTSKKETSVSTKMVETIGSKRMRNEKTYHISGKSTGTSLYPQLKPMSSAEAYSYTGDSGETSGTSSYTQPKPGSYSYTGYSEDSNSLSSFSYVSPRMPLKRFKSLSYSFTDPTVIKGNASIFSASSTKEVKTISYSRNEEDMNSSTEEEETISTSNKRQETNIKTEEASSWCAII